MKVHPIRRIIVAICALFASVGVTASIAVPSASALSSFRTWVGYGQQGDFGNAQAGAFAGPATAYAVMVRCDNTGSTWHLGNRESRVAPYASSYLCPSHGHVTQLSVQLYF